MEIIKKTNAIAIIYRLKKLRTSFKYYSMIKQSALI